VAEEDEILETDEGVTEADRIIPDIIAPQCLTNLKQRFILTNVQNLLTKHSDRFSLGFHAGKQNPASAQKSTGPKKRKIEDSECEIVSDDESAGPLKHNASNLNLYKIKNRQEEIDSEVK